MVGVCETKATLQCLVTPQRSKALIGLEIHHYFKINTEVGIVLPIRIVSGKNNNIFDSPDDI